MILTLPAASASEVTT